MLLRNENVRPQLVKNSQIINLNGIWDFAFDDSNIGHKEKWFLKPRFIQKINVPFPYESELSGIHDTSHVSTLVKCVECQSQTSEPLSVGLFEREVLDF